jgi:electron transport complex protein RnfG
MAKDENIGMVIAKLVIISIIASALLAAVYVPTQEQVKANAQQARTEALAEIMPSADSFEPVHGESVNAEGEREILYYRALDSSGNIVGYAFFKVQSGSQGQIEVAGGVDSQFTKVAGMDVLQHSETPGLGAKITEPEFKSQFNGLPLDDLNLKNDGGQVDAITGATISSRAVVDALDTKIDSIEDAEEQ